MCNAREIIRVAHVILVQGRRGMCSAHVKSSVSVNSFFCATHISSEMELYDPYLQRAEPVGPLRFMCEVPPPPR